MRLVSKTLLGIFSAAALNLSLIAPVMSISLEDTQKKLDVVAVFVLVDDRGDFYQISQGDMQIVPLYLRLSDADSQLKQFLESNKSSKARIAAYSLNVFNKKTADLRKLVAEKGKRLETPVVIPEADMTKGRDILREEGLSDANIASGLRVPVFFAEPMVVGTDSKGKKREIFFMSFSQLQQAVSVFPEDERSKLKIRVADLQVVLESIQRDKEDRYIFMPTEDYSKIRKEMLESKGASDKD